jgi:integrase
MPRLVHKVPKYAEHKASGRGKVRHGGKDHYFPGLYNSPESLKAYAEFVDGLLKRKTLGEPEAAGSGDPAEAVTAPVCLTVAELMKNYWVHVMAWYRRDGELTGEHAVIRSALRPLLRLFSDLLITEFKPRHLKAVREEMIRLDWSRRYINASVRRTKQMFNWGVEEELVPPEIAGALSRVRGLQKDRSAAREKPKVDAVSDAQVDAVLPRVSPLVRDMIKAMRLSGMRPGEALRITVEEIDRSDPECWVYKPTRHKTSHRGKTRVVFLGPKVQAILTPRILKVGTGRIFRITKGGFKRAIDKACYRAGIPRWAPNQLRHAAGTEIRNQFGLDAAQVILGHSKADVTEVYAEANMGRGRDIARKIG